MRGHYEESREVKAWRELRNAAAAYAARQLIDMNAGPDKTLEEQRLTAAAMAFSEATKPAKRRRTSQLPSESRSDG